MADFNSPTILTEYTAVLDQLRSSIASVAKMFDGTSDSNIPVGAVKLDQASSRFQRWNGTAWANASISGLLDGGISGQAIADNSIEGGKILLGADSWLRGGATGTESNLIKGSSASDTTIATPSGRYITMQFGGAAGWWFHNNFIAPTATDVKGFGTPTNRLVEVVTKNLNYIENIVGGLDVGSPTPLVIESRGNYDIKFARNGAFRWLIQDAALLPNVNDVTDIGSNSNRVKTAYLKEVRSCNLLDSSDDVLIGTVNAVKTTTLQAGSTQWRISTANGGSFLPVLNNTQALGGASNIISNAYIANILTCNFLESTSSLSLGTKFINNLTLKSNNTDRWAVDGSDGSFRPVSNNTLSLGQTGLRINTAFISTISKVSTIRHDEADLKVGTWGGNNLVLVSNATDRWIITNSGTLKPAAANTYAIGEDGFRVNSLWVNEVNSNRFTNKDANVAFGTFNNYTTQIIQNNTVRMAFDTNGSLNLYGQFIATGGKTPAAKYLSIFLDGINYYIQLYQ